MAEEHLMTVRHGGEAHESGPWITKDVVVLLHGLGMVVAWGIFFNLGSVIGRYYKKPPRDLFAPRWFEWHATFQTIGFVIALASALLIIVHLSWNGLPGEHFEGLHQVMGVFMVLCMIAQPIIGVEAHRDFLRLRGPGRFHPPHRWLGRFLMIASVPTMGFGLKELGKHIMEVDNVAWLSFAALVTLSIIIVSYGEWSLSGNAKPRPAPRTELEMGTLSNKDEVDATTVVDKEHYATDEVEVTEEPVLPQPARTTVNASVDSDSDGEDDDRTVVDFVFAREEVLRRERKRAGYLLIIYGLLTIGIVLFLCGYLVSRYRSMDMSHDDDD